MKFKIEKVKIEKFRAIERLETELCDKTILLGDNETSKTGFASAILWCLTGKSSDGNSAFEIVPSGKYGTVSPSVELECMVDDKPLTLKREYKAKYARDKSFKEYATTCYINGLEVGTRKFKDYISQNICNESVFKILSNPYTFVENCPKEQKELMWQGQRRMLMEMVSDTPDADLVAMDEKWSPLAEPLKRYSSINEYLAYLKQETTKAQKEVNSFEAKMEQQQSNLSEQARTKEEVIADIEERNNAIADIEAEIRYAQNNESAKHREELLWKMQDIQNRQGKIKEEYNKLCIEHADIKHSLEMEARERKVEADGWIAKQSKYAEAVAQLENTKPSEVCPTCKQKLPAGTIKETEEATKQRIEKGKACVEQARKNAEACMKAAQGKWAEAESRSEPVYPTKELDELQEMYDAIIAEYRSVENQKADTDELEAKLHDVETGIELSRKELYNIERNEECKERIRELEEAHRDNNKKLNEFQRFTDLCKDFVAFKCEQMQDKINGLFKNVKFQLFEQNKSNEDIREVCNMTFNGHKYEDLSASTKLVANMELLSAFQKHYDAYIPIVCDNMESVTADIVTDAQVIEMYVVEERCPNCGGKSGRRNADGKWTCESCGNRWEKKLEIKEE